MKKVKYTKPTGVDLVVNDNEINREYAKVHGWVEVKEKRQKKKEQVKQLDKLI